MCLTVQANDVLLMIIWIKTKVLFSCPFTPRQIKILFSSETFDNFKLIVFLNRSFFVPLSSFLRSFEI